MPALPRAHLVLVHAHLALAAFEARLNAGTRLDHTRELRQRRLCQLYLTYTGRREVVMVTVAGVLIGGIARGTGLQRPVIRQRTTGDDQPLFRSDPFALDPRLHSALDHLDLHWPFL